MVVARDQRRMVRLVRLVPDDRKSIRNSNNQLCRRPSLNATLNPLLSAKNRRLKLHSHRLTNAGQ